MIARCKLCNRGVSLRNNTAFITSIALGRPYKQVSETTHFHKDGLCLGQCRDLKKSPIAKDLEDAYRTVQQMKLTN